MLEWVRMDRFSAKAPAVWRLHIPDGALEGLKWIALASMLYDHVVRFLLMGPAPAPATAFGRIAFPLFAFTLAYNLSRPGLDGGIYRRLIMRLIGFGLLALPATLYLVQVQQLNILFTLATAVALVWILEQRPLWYSLPIAGILFAAAGTQVEYGWPGLALMLSFSYFIRRGVTLDSLAALAAGFMALSVSNGSQWGLLSLPIILAASQVTLPLRRHKWFFYAFYPAHLALIAWLAWQFVRI
ncbi:MAG: conjugal transfer protein TraX [Candidatus Moraniibacteriota bacterium]|nr:MAG: conjugal transfer protein TraX [Candidatus Moranbacteria bacterium]